MIHRGKEYSYYYGLKDFVKERSLLDMDMIFNKYPNELFPFDFDTYFSNGMTSEIVNIDGIPYLDGGLADSIPVKHVQEKGLKKIVLILTRPEGYRKKLTSKAVGKLYRKMYSKYPALVRTCIRRPVMYNRTEEYIEKLEKEGNIFVLRPEMKPVSRLEKDYDKLMAFYDHGYEMMKRELPRLEAYLEK